MDKSFWLEFLVLKHLPLGYILGLGHVVQNLIICHLHVTIIAISIMNVKLVNSGLLPKFNYVFQSFNTYF